MLKPYLLIAGFDYYPGHSTSDWVACFASEEEAEEYVKANRSMNEYPYTADMTNPNRFSCDWHVVVDLRDWAN